MSLNHSPPNPSPPVFRWRLWVDGCGGFLLLDGDCWSVGGVSPGMPADICVRADWPRNAGHIKRQNEDYFWFGSNASEPVLIRDEQPLSIPGSAAMKLRKPSPLCASATLCLQHPHRFSDHVDGVVLFADAVLIGPEADCHLRASHFADRVVLTRRDARWIARVGHLGDFIPLTIGQRSSLSSITMTMEAI